MCPVPMIPRSRPTSWQPLAATRALCGRGWTSLPGSPAWRWPVLTLAGLDPARREAAAMALRAKGGAAVATLTRVVLQCYYRDDRVVRSLGLEPRPPHPKGHVLEDGDWSLLDPVRARAPTWRRA